MQSPESWTATVDYTSTVLVDATPRPSVTTLLNHQLSTEVARGNVPRDFSLHGYTGQRIGGLQVARQAERLWVSCIGATAQEYGVGWLMLAHHATRIDLALTARFYPPLKDLALTQFKRNFAITDGKSKNKYSYVCGNDGGQTLYCGSRKSPMFGRLYDSGIKERTAPAGTVWRWELETKAKRSEQLRRVLLSSGPSSTIIAGLVLEWFTRHGVNVPHVADARRLDALPKREQGNVWDTLEWFSQQVEPSVRRLIAAGHRERILVALGLSKEG